MKKDTAKLSDYAKSWPYFLYKSIALANTIERLYFYLPNGVSYLFKRINATYDQFGQFIALPQIAIFFGERDEPLQPEPIDAALLVTPGEIFKNPPLAPVRELGARKLSITYNYMFVNSGIVKIEITSGTIVTPNIKLNLMIEGRSIANYGSRAVA
jgi:hypothetical protein